MTMTEAVSESVVVGRDNPESSERVFEERSPPLFLVVVVDDDDDDVTTVRAVVVVVVAVVFVNWSVVDELSLRWWCFLCELSRWESW
jgi:hypothetical protein